MPTSICCQFAVFNRNHSKARYDTNYQLCKWKLVRLQILPSMPHQAIYLTNLSNNTDQISSGSRGGGGPLPLLKLVKKKKAAA